MAICGECGRHVMGSACTMCKDPVRVYRNGEFVEEVRRIPREFDKKDIYYKGRYYVSTWDGYAGAHKIEIGVK